MMEWQLHSVVSQEALASLEGLAFGAPAGAFVEVGVYRGGSAERLDKIAREQGRELYLFDTFDGIPFQFPVDGIPVGAFSDTSADAIRKWFPKAKVYAGIFPFTLPDELEGIAFAHVDCDQYLSVRSCIECLFPRMVDGGVMLFDDWRSLEGATIAVIEGFGEDLPETPEGKAYAIKGRHPCAYPRGIP